MTPEERFEKIERNLSEIGDTLAVTAELQRRSEQRCEQEHARIWDALHAFDDRQAIIQAALQSLTLNIDRFIQGKGGNGNNIPS